VLASLLAAIEDHELEAAAITVVSRLRDAEQHSFAGRIADLASEQGRVALAKAAKAAGLENLHNVLSRVPRSRKTTMKAASA
jgi:hypothetical protein